MELKDKFGRVHRSLRISVMDKCNLRCTYCMPENMQFLKHKALMSREEIQQIAAVFVQEFGINKIRITGGEPLLRKDIGYVVSDMNQLGVETGLTTNAIKLDEHIDELIAAGSRSVNISLDSLDAKRFKLMTRRDGLEKVLRNIEIAHSKGLHVKVNMVVMKGINIDEILPFVELTKRKKLHIRFIEFMPFAGNGWKRSEVFGYKDMLKLISQKHSIHKLNDKPNSTAKAWQVDGYEGTFAVISTVSEPFCESCDRLRLTAEGKMRNCLFSQEETDLLSAFRKGEDIRELIIQNVLGKKKMLGGLPAFENEKALEETLSERPMVSIGG